VVFYHSENSVSKKETHCAGVINTATQREEASQSLTLERWVILDAEVGADLTWGEVTELMSAWANLCSFRAYL